MKNLKVIEPLKEVTAYEALWQDRNASFKSLSELFLNNPGRIPSDLVQPEIIEELYSTIKQLILNKQFDYRTYLLINGTFDYPSRLRDAKEPIEVLYYSGNIDYLSSRCISIVGTRKPSEEGLRRAKKLVSLLVKDDFTIVSGLATGIDTQAHKTAIEKGGRTIGVIGTPLDTFYPKENKELQKVIAKDHLLISQVPFYRYKKQSIAGNKLFFPERNKTMSALSEATVIVEASETSGTLTQARAALYQGRKLFILDSCFERKDITWPQRFADQGAIRVKEYEDIIKHLPPITKDNESAAKD
ncbi:MAG: DNA-protecting protein DprA [Sphingobacteriales bacterium]|nr:DNA-protecting protein DprA [Sphingobacteriales bacterium]